MQPTLPGASGGTALVTGASSGIGYEFTLLLARHGYDLVVVGRNQSALHALAERVRHEFGVRVEVCAKNLAVPKAAHELFEELSAKGFYIDVLVNIAGFAIHGPVHENDPATLAEMLHVNVLALTQLTRLFLPGMLKRGRGKILNMSSIGAYMPGPLMAAYFASKAYVLSFSEALANEVRGTGVSVTALCPGPTRTRFASRARLDDTKAFRGALMEPAQVAREGFDALMKGKPALVSGFKFRWQTVPLSLIPRQLLAKIARAYHETNSPIVTDAAMGWTADGAGHLTRH